MPVLGVARPRTAGPPGPHVGYECTLRSRLVMSAGPMGSTTSSSSTRYRRHHLLFLNLAGTHRGKAIVDDLIAAKQAGEPLEDVVWDPGLQPVQAGHGASQTG